MRKPELSVAIASKIDITRDSAAEVLSIILEEITNALANNETVSLVGFGTFSKRERKARVGINPQTGASINIAASNSVGFKAGKALKDAVKS